MPSSDFMLFFHMCKGKSLATVHKVDLHYLKVECVCVPLVVTGIQSDCANSSFFSRGTVYPTEVTVQ